MAFLQRSTTLARVVFTRRQVFTQGGGGMVALALAAVGLSTVGCAQISSTVRTPDPTPVAGAEDRTGPVDIGGRSGLLRCSRRRGSRAHMSLSATPWVACA